MIDRTALIQGVDAAADFHPIFDRAPVGIIIHRQGRPLYCNPAFARIHRLSGPDAVLRLGTLDELGLGENLLDRGDAWRNRRVLPGGAVVWTKSQAWPIDLADGPATLWFVRDISAAVGRETLDAELRETLDRFSDAIIVTDAEHRIVFTNQRYHALFTDLPERDALLGQSFAAVVRQTVGTGLLEDEQALSDPDAYVAARMAERAALSGKRRSVRLFRGRWIETMDERISGGAIVSIFTDIHDRKLAEDALAAAQAAGQSMAARMGAAIEALPVSFLMVDEDFNYLDWNQRYEEQRGEALTGRRLNLRDIMLRQAERGDYTRVRFDPARFTDDDIAATPCLGTLLRCQAARGLDDPMSDAEIAAYIEWNMLLFGETPRVDGQHWEKPREYFKADTNRIIETRINRVPGVGWVLIYTDVTETRAAETELRLAKETAEKAVQEIKQAQARLVQSEKLASLGQLVAGVAHEINTPIGISVTAASKLKAEVAQIAQRHAENQLRRADLAQFMETAATLSELLLSSSERAARLVRSFKLVAVDRASDQRRRFDLGLYITEILRSLGPMLREAGIAVVLDLPPLIEVDTFPGMFSQVVINLVGNVITHAYAEDELGMLRLGVRAIGNGQIRMILRDDGKGIAPADLPKIFDPFFTTKRGSSDGGNVGLGLHIVHNLVTGPLGGTLEVDSAPDKGTGFTIILPQIAP